MPPNTGGKANAAPISKHPSKINPASNPSKIKANGTVENNNVMAIINCNRNRDPVATTHARGLALAKSGICTICQIRDESATAVPINASTMPDTHQEARNSSVPEICAP